MAYLARKRGSVAARAEQNAAVLIALEEGRLDEGIGRLEVSLKTDDRPFGRLNLAGLLAKRGKKGDMEKAFEEFKRAFDLGFCVSLEELKADKVVGSFFKHPDYQKFSSQVENLVKSRGDC